MVRNRAQAPPAVSDDSVRPVEMRRRGHGADHDAACFDTYVVVDWSASSKPRQGKDSIWVCAVAGTGGDVFLANPRTRRDAGEFVVRRLLDECEEHRRVLVGFDFPYGYPAGLAGQLGLGASAPWRAIWRHLRAQITDGPTNVNNRFVVAAAMNARLGAASGPFWGCPPAVASSQLTMRRLCTFPFSGGGNHQPLSEYRLTEQHLRRGLPVQATWKLLGAGSVGSQALMGIPVVEALRDHPQLEAVSEVWPFETGLSLHHGPGPRVVHAEIWPGAVPLNSDLHRIKDAAQVLTLAHRLAELDRSGGALGEWFAPRLDAEQERIVTGEEGWILGA